MEKELVQKFDLEAAFKALDEIEIPASEKGLRANRVNLKERFSTKEGTDALCEDYYNINDPEALEEAKEDRDAEVAKAKLARIEKIVDLDADTEDDLLPSYVGKVIIQCPQCMTLFYKNPEDIEKSEENPDVVNLNEICQHCGNSSGYTLIGKVDEVSEDEAANYEAAEEAEESELDLDFGEPTEEVSPEGTGGGFEEFEETEVVEEDSSEDSSDDELDLVIDDADIVAEESLKVEKVEPTAEATPLVEETVTEGVDKELDAKLKAHNEYIDYLKKMIEQEEEALKHATNEEVKAVIEKRLHSLEDDLKAALPEAVKDEVASDDLPTPEEAEIEVEAEKEETKESLTLTEDVAQENKKLDEAIVDFENQVITVDEDSSSDDSSDDSEDTVVIGSSEAVLAEGIEDELVKYAASLTLDDVKEDLATEQKLAQFEANLQVEPTLGEGLKEDIYDVSDAEFKSMLQNKVFQEFGEELKEEKVEEELPSSSTVDKIVSDIEHAGEGAEEEGEEVPTEEGYTGNPAERTTHLEYTDDNPADGKAVLPDNIEKQLTEEDKKEETHVCEKCGKEVCECEKKLNLGEALEDLDEKTINKHISDYLTEVYSNVKEFKTTGCAVNESKLTVEGIISFNSGKEKETVFEFINAKEDAGKLIFEGINKDLVEDGELHLHCSINENKCLITESFGYKYTINDTLVEGLK